MKVRLSKCFCGLAMVLLMAGAFCFVPSFLKKGENQEAGAVTLADFMSRSEAMASANSTSETWSAESDVTRNLTTGNFNGKSVYQITSLEDLALLSLKVSNGESDYVNGEFYVTANEINLGGKLWTPIGTKTNPFKGKFFGNFVTIKNIWVTDQSLGEEGSAYGLFGNVGAGAVISNVNVDGVDAIVSSDKSGVLVGYLENAKVTNCHDLRTNRSEIKTISGAATGSIYFGGTIDGESAYFTNAEDAKSSVTYSGVTESGYVGIYRMEEGNFKASDISGSCKMINVAIDENLEVLAV